jgi:hypothetical protein
LYLGRIGAFITADSRGLPEGLRRAALNQNVNVAVICGTFMASTERQMMGNFFREAKMKRHILENARRKK